MENSAIDQLGNWVAKWITGLVSNNQRGRVTARPTDGMTDDR